MLSLRYKQKVKDMKALKMKKVILITSVLFFATISLFAQNNTPRVDKREGVQRARIAQGTSSGEITQRERAALNAQQRHIRRSERRAKADGTVTVRERRRLSHQQNRANRNIRRAKHNEISN